MTTTDWLEQLIMTLIDTPSSDLTGDFIKQQKRAYAKAHAQTTMPSNIQLLQAYQSLLKAKKISKHDRLRELLKKRAIRSQSGIVSVQVLTKPYRCPGKCIFCPNDFTMPKSYINTEPGAMRALLNNFDPIKQVYNRLLSLTLTGHQTDKIEMIVLGGTRDVYPDDYKELFVKSLYDACNTFPEYYESVTFAKDEKKSHYSVVTENKNITDNIAIPWSLQETLAINETADNRIIGLTVETRPEYVTHKNCQFRRKLGVTRLEMGIQSTNDEVLKANKRWHDTEQSRQAVHILRQYGFKFSLHIMPWLYWSDEDKDLQTFIDTYADPFFKPDEIKFYPTSVIPNTELYDLYRKGEYTPIETEQIKRIVKKTFLDIIPPYTRIKRLIRDIPSTEIIAGSNITNLAQMTHDELKKSRKGMPEALHLYNRLYPNHQLFSSFIEYLAQDNHPETAIIWSAPDLASFRQFVSLDTRAREIRNNPNKDKQEADLQPNLIIRHYRSSVGTELFISVEDQLGYLYGFTRLLLPDSDKTVEEWQVDWLWPTIAMIRELHVYGKVAWLRDEKQAIWSDKTKSQHQGIGSLLMSTAEQITTKHHYKALSVISGIGVRGYYEKLGYGLVGTYMVKKLSS